MSAASQLVPDHYVKDLSANGLSRLAEATDEAALGRAISVQLQRSAAGASSPPWLLNRDDGTGCPSQYALRHTANPHPLDGTASLRSHHNQVDVVLA
ncbi:MAG TPA: hypothetical protein VD833_22110, partial [Vicinamibacterales bacterium]|nr:hypothetical protein [Vicinamibacterales bacterium]